MVEDLKRDGGQIHFQPPDDEIELLSALADCSMNQNTLMNLIQKEEKLQQRIKQSHTDIKAILKKPRRPKNSRQVKKQNSSGCGNSATNQRQSDNQSPTKNQMQMRETNRTGRSRPHGSRNQAASNNNQHDGKSNGRIQDMAFFNKYRCQFCIQEYDNWFDCLNHEKLCLQSQFANIQSPFPQASSSKKNAQMMTS